MTFWENSQGYTYVVSISEGKLKNDDDSKNVKMYGYAVRLSSCLKTPPKISSVQ